VTERRQHSDKDGLLLKSPGDFCAYREARDDSHLPAADGEASFVLTEERLLSLLRRASEEAYRSAAGKSLVDVDDDELVKHRSSLKRSLTDWANLEVRGRGDQTSQAWRGHSYLMLVMMGARHAYDGVHRRFLDETTTNTSKRHSHHLDKGQEVRGPETICYRRRQARRTSDRSH